MTEDPITAYPLAWPHGWKRHSQRVRGQFRSTAGSIVTELLHEIDLLVLGDRARNWTISKHVIISSNARVSRDGTPYASDLMSSLGDPGVAVYFERNEKKVCMACDRYDRPWKNLRAIQLTIEAMRAIDRHGGSGLLDRAFTGFEALPAPGETSAKTWRVVLGFDANARPTLQDVDEHWRELCRKCHPDVSGGSHDAMAEVNTARDQAREELGNS